MNHIFRFGYDFGLPCHTGKMMSRIRVIPFNSMRVCFAYDMAVWWKKWERLVRPSSCALRLQGVNSEYSCHQGVAKVSGREVLRIEE